MNTASSGVKAIGEAEIASGGLMALVDGVKRLLGPNEYAVNGFGFSRPSHADPKLIDRYSGSPERTAFLAANCRKLADLMERLPAENHDQGNWFPSQGKEHECGTSGCALGWAARSHIIPGLQHRVPAFNNARPTMNGATVEWNVAGVAFFGREAYNSVFSNGHLSKDRVVSKLRGLARKLSRA